MDEGNENEFDEFSESQAEKVQSTSFIQEEAQGCVTQPINSSAFIETMEAGEVEAVSTEAQNESDEYVLYDFFNVSEKGGRDNTQIFNSDIFSNHKSENQHFYDLLVDHFHII